MANIKQEHRTAQSSMPQVGTYDEEYLLQRAAGIVKDKTKDSTIFSEEAESMIPTFATSGES